MFTRTTGGIALAASCCLFTSGAAFGQLQTGAATGPVTLQAGTVKCGGEIIVEQTADAGNSTPSQDFPSTDDIDGGTDNGDDYDVEAADDFVVPGSGLLFSAVDINGFLSTTAGPIDNVVLRIYSDGGGAPGGLAYTETFSGAAVDPDNDGSFSLVPVTAPFLAGGTYWLSVQAEMSFTAEQWFWTAATDGVGDVWQIRNLGGGFETIGTCSEATSDWTDGAACGFAFGAGPGLMYTIHLCPDLSAIPTVSEWGLIVLGLLLLTAGTIVIRRTRVQPRAA